MLFKKADRGEGWLEGHLSKPGGCLVSQEEQISDAVGATRKSSLHDNVSVKDPKLLEQ